MGGCTRGGLARAVVLLSIGSGCAAPAPITDPTTPWPRWLSALDVDLTGDGDDAHGDGLAYAVGHELWVGDAQKDRRLLLAAGASIDDRDRERWRFAAGTVAIKTIAFDGRPIETRAIRALDDDAWEYVAYRWTDDGRDAERLDLEAPRAIALDDGAVHEVPSRRQCRQCHESGPTPLLGLGELQLADADAGDGSELERFDRVGALLAGAPVDPRRVQGDPATRAVLGWFVGNCVHCHNGGAGENASFDLDPAVAVANLVGRPTESSASGSGERIVPGDPESSLLFLAVSGTHDDPEIDAMPPVGTTRRDDAAIATLRAWIEGLAP